MKEDVYEVLGIATNTVTDENLVVCRKVQDPVGIIWERPEQKRFERMDAEYVPETNDGDTISRKAVLDIAFKYCPDDDGVCSEAGSDLRNMLDEIENLPPAEPKIIYCKDCRKHNKRIGDYVEKSDGTYDWIWKDQACPLAEFRGVAQGHEFDYQFCAFGERRTE